MRLYIVCLMTLSFLLAGCGTTLSGSGSESSSVRPETVPMLAETSDEQEQVPSGVEVELFPELLEPVHAAVPGEVVETVPGGEIDWSGNSIRATGTGVVDTGNPNLAQARLMAERAAVVVAQRNLLEAVQGVTVDSETRVENFMTDYDVIYTRVEGVVRNARQPGPAVYDSVAGTVAVELEMEIYGSRGLAGALSTAFAGTDPGQVSMSDQTRDFLQQYSALVLDGSQAGLQPSLYPKIYDADGNLLLDTSLYASYLGSGGSAALQFVSDLDRVLSLPAFSGSPLVLSVRQVTGQLGTDIILGREESDAMGWLGSALPFLLSAGKFLLGVI
ncbi:MAG: hypothetical protein AVO35_11770 [Candidatus Aegiribacteria sp. MLS_C]|nr:MAG: hypothetical protein AVO35_11770 [Candidatus Aegiribacteria sp. MLS_C]